MGSFFLHLPEKRIMKTSVFWGHGKILQQGETKSKAINTSG